VPYPLDNALYQWEEGNARLRELSRDPRMAGRVNRAVEAVRDELRRRIGPTFSTSELADLYARGTDWTLDLAVSVAPGAPFAWDPRTVADAAFARYVREAADFAGGRRLEPG
jgi:hypothetical protein